MMILLVVLLLLRHRIHWHLRWHLHWWGGSTVYGLAKPKGRVLGGCRNECSWRQALGHPRRQSGASTATRGHD